MRPQINLKNVVLIIVTFLGYFSDLSETSKLSGDRKDFSTHQAQFSNLFKRKFAKKSSKQFEISDQVFKSVQSVVKLVDGKEIFRDMKKSHKMALGDLKNIFRAQKSTLELLNLAEALRDYPEMNYKLWLNAILSVGMERSDLIGLTKPDLLKTIPESFINVKILKELQRQATLTKDQRWRVRMNGRITEDNGREHVLWYFREDLLANIQHMFWHMTNPTDLETYSNSKIKVDRKGELFYYFHHNFLARYNAERLGNGLERVRALDLDEGGVVEEGYNPHMDEMSSVKSWGHRPQNTILTKMKSSAELRRLIYADIEAQSLIHMNESLIPMKNLRGIDLLGDLVESSSLSINLNRYDTHSYGLHGLGHATLANLSINGSGVMESTILAMRDPIFYRWHELIEQLFQAHKSTLDPYTPHHGELELWCPGVTVQEFFVQTHWGKKGGGRIIRNELETFFGDLNVPLPLSGDGVPVEQLIEYCITRLEHSPFQYGLVIDRESNSTSPWRATIRIFMAPRFNETGARFSMEEQRGLFFAMDEFVVELDVGRNVITRQSNESSLSLQWNFQEGVSIPPSAELPHCGCGWPHHLLLPKGSSKGMIFDLFAIVTDGRIDLPNYLEPIQEPVCRSSHILCGKFSEKYPDARPMGYPFDRRPYGLDGEEGVVADLDEYVRGIENMKTVEVKIFNI